MANLKFISTGSTTVTLSGNGLPNSFTANGSAYTLGTAISLSDGQYVQFAGTTSNFSKDSTHYYQFTIGGTGTVTVEGDLISLINNNAYVKQYQFINLFRGCAKITSIANLNFPTSIADWCYANMFLGCTGLTNGAITLPATILANWCYANMFAGCSSLVQAPQINATKAAPYSLYCMFQDCSSLLNAPSIVIKNLDKSFSCNSMFRNCQSLSSISVSFNSMTNSNNQTKDWLYNVAPNGTFTKSTTLTSYTVGVNGIPNGWTIEEGYPSVINAVNQTFSFDAMEQSWALETLVYTYNGTETVTFTLDSSLLPNGVYFANGVFSGLGLEMNYNTTTYTQVIPITLSTTTLDAAPVTINATVELYDIPTATIAIDTIPAITFDYTNQNICSANLTSYINYNGSSTVNYGLIGELPDGVYFTDGILSGDKDYISNVFGGDFILTAQASDTRLASTSFLFVIEGVDPDYSKIPITFEPLVDNSTFRINAYNNPNTKQFKYRINYQPWQDYSMDNQITASIGDRIAFSGDAAQGSTADTNYIHFITSQKCIVYGNIMSFTTSNATRTYNSLFKETKVVDASNLILPTNSMRYASYQFLFRDCTSLTAVPQLPATSLADKCYTGMFQGCTALSTVPVDLLPATTLNSRSYQSMFMGCSKLTTPPELPASTLANDCYNSMFSNCSKLTAVPALPAKSIPEYAYDSMFYGCTSLSTVPVDLLPASGIGWRSYRQMFMGCSKLTTPPELPATNLNQKQHCYESMFQNCTSLTAVPALPATDFGTSNNGEAVYQYMFAGCTALSTVPVDLLPATNLTQLCYKGMFNGCTNLRNVPLLTATTVSHQGYHSMFAGCSSLSSVPEDMLPATTLASNCYANMFQGCTYLTATPQLPATTLAESCYNSMFQGCSKLSNVSILPALTAVQYCYNAMFRECTSLTSVPYNMLPATTLQGWGSYNSMFIYCSNLTSAPYLPASGLSNQSYLSMFRGCSKLSSINVSFTAWSPRNATEDWVTNVAANGTFTCPTALGTDSTITRGTNNCPTNWTVVNK